MHESTFEYLKPTDDQIERMARVRAHRSNAKLLLLTSAIGLAALAGCTTPGTISSNPVTTATNTVSAAIPQLAPVGNGINAELLNAEQNLKNGVTIGILQPTDPVLGCLQQVNTQLGIEPGTAAPPATSFTPIETGPIDTGAALYVIAQQALALKNGGITVPTSCKAIIGDLVLKGQANTTQLLPGGGLLPILH